MTGRYLILWWRGHRTVESIYGIILQNCPIVTIVTEGENPPQAQLVGCQALYYISLAELLYN